MDVSGFLLDNSWLLLGVMVGVALAIARIGVWLADRFLSAEVLKRQHDVTAALLGVVGMVYAVLLAFVVLVVWQEFNDAKRTVEHEQAVARTLMRTILRYPEPDRSDMRAALGAYTTSVAEVEFPAMVSGDREAIRNSPALDRLWNEIEKASRVEGPRMEALYGTILSSLNELGLDRSQRLRASRDSIPWAIWVVLVLGGLITVGLSVLFVTEAPKHRFAMAGPVAVMLALVIFTVALLDHPFMGSIAIDHHAYTTIAAMTDLSGPPTEAVASDPGRSPPARGAARPAADPWASPQSSSGAGPAPDRPNQE